MGAFRLMSDRDLSCPNSVQYNTERRAMRSVTRLGGALAVLVIEGCVSQLVYWDDTNLQSLSPGWSRQQFLAQWSDPDSNARVAQPVLRAAKNDQGKVTEVFTLDMRDQFSQVTPYWFVFEDGVLRQWGPPGDWAQVAATYDIDFDPFPDDRTPF